MADASRAWSRLRSGGLAQTVARLVERRCALAGRIVAPLCAAPCEMVARRMRATMDGEWSTGCERRRAAAYACGALLRTMRAGRATLRAASCAAAAIFLVVAPPLAAAPASLRRCRDGWSDFF
ncbi:chloroplast elongation factor G [Dorcoceras hygrometricum]|uniref:Chloroplast elongation factor G n=1 Tax=Dorcoceras hygrometricum TaxID=472368 RepID=A0A2Z6ZVA8_9LAMI|nr:chloroplast elongation factor G [Dorcoceras hygrometricum]